MPIAGVCAKLSPTAEDGMRIYTITQADRAVAVVRAADPADAIDTALALLPASFAGDDLAVRDPNDAEMVGWLARRSDYVTEPATAG
jgi:hypothetical protein